MCLDLKESISLKLENHQLKHENEDLKKKNNQIAKSKELSDKDMQFHTGLLYS